MGEKVETKMEKKEEKKKIAEAGASDDMKVVNKKKSDDKVKVIAKGDSGENSAKQGGALKECDDKNCHIHGSLKTRGKIFEGKVIKKFPKRVAIEFERMIYIRKYERYAKSRTKIHARLPDCMKNEISIGDLIKVQECRPLSKIIHFVVIGKVGGKIK